MNAGWSVERETGPAGVLHEHSVGALGERRVVRILAADSPALVLGSSQPLSDVDARAARRRGIEVVRRRTGGGAVLVGPGEAVWVDLVVPAGDPLWDDDVGRAAWWIGELWAGALEQIDVGPASVWKAGMVQRPGSKQLCFAGLGPGEVTVGERKVVGVSQRRTRAACLFQTAVLLRWDPALMVELLGVRDVPSVVTIPAAAEARLVEALLNGLS